MSASGGHNLVLLGDFLHQPGVTLKPWKAAAQIPQRSIGGDVIDHLQVLHVADHAIG